MREGIGKVINKAVSLYAENEQGMIIDSKKDSSPGQREDRTPREAARVCMGRQWESFGVRLLNFRIWCHIPNQFNSCFYPSTTTCSSSDQHNQRFSVMFWNTVSIIKKQSLPFLDSTPPLEKKFWQSRKWNLIKIMSSLCESMLLFLVFSPSSHLSLKPLCFLVLQVILEPQINQNIHEEAPSSIRLLPLEISIQVND